MELNDFEALLDRKLGTLKRDLDTRLAALDTRLTHSDDATKTGIAELNKRINERLDSLDDRMKRQGKRLESIELFPQVETPKPGRLYATEMGSVSLPIRARAGRTG